SCTTRITPCTKRRSGMRSTHHTTFRATWPTSPSGLAQHPRVYNVALGDQTNVRGAHPIRHVRYRITAEASHRSGRCERILYDRADRFMRGTPDAFPFGDAA